MMVSIITITFNNFHELKITLESIPASGDVESVVVNGGNDPETAGFLKNYPGKVISGKDDGIADAFNKGLGRAAGEYIMFLNSGDTLLDREYPKIAARFLDEHPEISFVHSSIIFRDSVGGEIFMRPQMKSPGRGQPYFHPTMVVRKTCFDEVGKFNTEYKISMDFDFIVRLERKGLKGHFLQGEAVVKMDGTGKSATGEKEAIKECYRALKENDLLTARNQAGFFIRKLLFSLRRLMILLGLKKLLGLFKRMKHHS